MTRARLSQSRLTLRIISRQSPTPSLKSITLKLITMTRKTKASRSDIPLAITVVKQGKVLPLELVMATVTVTEKVKNLKLEMVARKTKQ